MSSESTNLHQVVFKWPHMEPTTVIVTGTFDEWKSSIRLVKNQTGFEGAIQIPWGQKIKFKFIVDGEWLLHEDQPTEVDPGGYTNNVYTAPAKPVNLALETTSLPFDTEKLTTVDSNNHRTNSESVVAGVAEKPESTPQTLPMHTKSLTGITDSKPTGAEQKTSDTPTPELFSDMASTIAARDGTSSALGYVASGLGAAMHSAVGIDPINVPKIAIPTPKSNDDFILPLGMSAKSPTIVEESATESPPSPMAPLMPILIVPVNAAENNTVAPSSPLESMYTLPRFAPRPSMPDMPDTTLPDPNDVPDVDAFTEKVAVDTPVVDDALPVLETVIKDSTTSDTVVPLISDVAPAVESGTQEKTNGHSPDLAVVNTPHIPDSAVEESATAPVVNEESASVDAIPPESEEPAEKFPEPGASSKAVHEDLEIPRSIPIASDLDLNVTLATAKTTLVPLNEAIVPPIHRPTSIDEVKPEEDLSPDPNEGSSDTKPPRNVVVEELPATKDYPTTKGVQTTAASSSSIEHSTTIPKREFAEASVIAQSHAVIAAEEVAELVPTPQIIEDIVPDTNHLTPIIPTTPRKETPAIGSVKDIQEFPSSQSDSPSQTVDNSPSSSKFNSARKKRTSIFGKIKNIFHHDKEKENK